MPNVEEKSEVVQKGKAAKKKKKKKNAKLDHHCKTGKLRQLEKFIESIRKRTEAWLKYARKNPSVKGLKKLFTQQELKDAKLLFVPRCKYKFLKESSISVSVALSKFKSLNINLEVLTNPYGLQKAAKLSAHLLYLRVRGVNLNSFKLIIRSYHRR